jgi:hypothetical protein
VLPQKDKNGTTGLARKCDLLVAKTTSTTDKTIAWFKSQESQNTIPPHRQRQFMTELEGAHARDVEVRKNPPERP